MERTHQPSAVEVAEEARGPLARLRGLLTAAREAQGPARVELAGQVNRVLSNIREPGNEAEKAQLLVVELDAHAFDDLYDESGVSCRKQAVQALLSLGFPHALQVDPGDLAYARKEEARRRPRPAGEDRPVPGAAKRLARSRRNALFLAGAGGGLLLLYAPVLLFFGSPLIGILALVQGLLAAGTSGYLSGLDRPLEHQALPLAGLAVAALLAIGLIPGAGWAAAIAAGLNCAALGAHWHATGRSRVDRLLPPGGQRSPLDDPGARRKVR